MRLPIFMCLLFVITTQTAFAQQLSTQQAGDLSTDSIQIVTGVGDFDQPVVKAVGQLTNHSGSSAYTNISLTAEAYDTQNNIVGEGIGVLVNACGAGLLSDFTLQPNDSQTFSAPLELDDTEADVDHVEVSVDAQPTDPDPADPPSQGIEQITDAETVNVEWIDNHSFRYSTGCENDLFTNWDWYVYNTDVKAATLITPPHAQDVTDAMRARLQLDDNSVLQHSMLRYVPDGQRLVYQNARNDFLTAYIDGTFRRGMYDDLNNRTLQGIYWEPQERFLAYYYGAYGDPVYYFTADAEARTISPPLDKNPPSQIVPGVSRDGRRVVVAGDFKGETGYYLYVVTNGYFELQFQAEPPGNNYPAPIPLAHPTDNDTIDQIYVALPLQADDSSQSHLQCFNRTDSKVYDLAPLPLNLADNERAWWWISPDDSKIALAANGVNGGLWLIDLSALPGCGSLQATPQATATS